MEPAALVARFFVPPAAVLLVEALFFAVEGDLLAVDLFDEADLPALLVVDAFDLLDFAGPADDFFVPLVDDFAFDEAERDDAALFFAVLFDAAARDVVEPFFGTLFDELLFDAELFDVLFFAAGFGLFDDDVDLLLADDDPPLFFVDDVLVGICFLPSEYMWPTSR